MDIDKWVNAKYLKSAKSLRSTFTKAKPFKNIELKDFFDAEKLVLVVQSLISEKFIEKESDLFKFMQTNDLASSKHTTLLAFREFLCSSSFISFMQDITGLKLKSGIIDIAGTLYRDSDYLLCHDDQLESRKIAFMIYLSDLASKEGGSLDLLSTTYKPIVKIIPKFNTVAFFEVSPISFHEVSEVLVDKQRLAIGGWFYARD